CIRKPEGLAGDKIIERLLQDVDIALFTRLQADDILFIDSSHVAKAGSDLLNLFFEVLPRLNPGTLVHFHDVFNRFEYPAAWLREGRAWNEQRIEIIQRRQGRRREHVVGLPNYVPPPPLPALNDRSEEHTSELQSRFALV